MAQVMVLYLIILIFCVCTSVCVQVCIAEARGHFKVVFLDTILLVLRAVVLVLSFLVSVGVFFVCFWDDITGPEITR